MKKRGLFVVTSMCLTFAATAASHWLVGDDEQKLTTIEKQFRGFDVAMAEVGYRYQELYWAGVGQNWPYAEYQLSKIRKTIKNAIQRRPKRAKSADFFLSYAIPRIEQAIKNKKQSQFSSEFSQFTNECNACHVRENMAFVHVVEPSHRPAPLSNPNRVNLGK